MNGATAELSAKINSTANSSKLTNIGAIHRRLFFQKNTKSSPTMPNRWLVVPRKPIHIPLPCIDCLTKNCNSTANTVTPTNYNPDHNSDNKTFGGMPQTCRSSCAWE